jgi:hypothetical protein
LGRSVSGMHPRGEKAAPERPSEARCKPPRGWAWLRDRMVSANEAGINLREKPPLPRNILHTWRDAPGLRGSDCIQCGGLAQRMAEAGHRKGPARKAARGHWFYPLAGRDTAKSGMGCWVNRHLHDLAESITMNVGGPCGEGCRPPMKRTGVGGPIVLGARESRVQGEGGQGSDVRRTNSRRASGEVRMKPGDPGCSDERKPMTASAGSRHSLESRMP